MPFGLTTETVSQICGVLARHPRVEKALLYGSRAKGSHRDGSDIDLALYGTNLDWREQATILDELDDLLLPYQIDLSIFDQLDHAPLREHIERVGQEFYRRTTTSDRERTAV